MGRMPQYLVGLLAAFLAPVLHAPANILDSYFSNWLFTRLSSLIFFSMALNLLFLPFLFFLGLPGLIPRPLWPVLVLLALVDVFWLYPYYWALRRTDTSIAVSLFSIGDLFVPLLAFFIVGEVLTPLQYVGFFAIVFSSVALTHDHRGFRFNPALFSMVAVSLLLALAAVLEKYLFVHGVDFVSTMTWVAVLQFASAGIFLAFTHRRRDAVLPKRAGVAVLGAIVVMQLLTWVGDAADTFAASLIPVSVVVGIVATQPLIALGYALLFEKRHALFFKEHIRMAALRKKVPFFICMIIGTVLVSGLR